MEMPKGAKTQVIRNVSYIFIDKPYWNTKKKRGEHKRNYIDKLVDGEFIPNGKYLLSLQEATPSSVEKKVAEPCQRQFCGATHLLDERLEANWESMRNCKLASRCYTVRLNRSAIISSWRAVSLCIGFANGGSRIVIRLVRFSPLSVSASCSATSQKMRR